MQQHGLWTYVEKGEGVLMAATCDGGDLAWKLTQVSAGVKIVDPRAIDPRTGRLLFGESGYAKVQSCTVCYPLHIYLAKDNQQFYINHLSGFFNDINQLEDDHQNGLKFAQPADMSSLQKTVKRGGAMKNKTYGCYCCNIHKNDLCKANVLPCHDCQANGLTQACYHQPVSDEAMLERLKAEKIEHEQAWPHLARVQLPLPGSKIRFGSTGMIDPRTDPRHIDYVGPSVEARVQHVRLLENELRLRGIPPASRRGAELCLQLHEILLAEQAYSLLKKVVECNNLDEAMILIEKALPCLLHLENRTSEAMIGRLFRRGFELREGDKEATEALQIDIEKTINERIFGQVDCPSNWQYPKKDDGTLGAIKFANWRARQIVEEIDGLIDVCVTTDEERQRWKEVFEAYRNTIKVCNFRFYYIL